MLTSQDLTAIGNLIKPLEAKISTIDSKVTRLETTVKNNRRESEREHTKI